jgi:hypothetical protein
VSLRPPSNVVAYDDFFSADPAIVQPPKERTTEQSLKELLDEHARKLVVARETGRWEDVTVPGRTPARFKMQPLTGNVRREILDAIERRGIGSHRAAQIAFRVAFKGVTDPELGDTVKLELEDTDRYGKIAAIAVADFFDRIDPQIVTELGNEAVRRASDLSPK